MEPEAYEELHQLESVHWWYRGMRQITDSLLRANLRQADHLRILDAGCGTGGNLAALAGFGRCMGIDYSPLALTYAQEQHAGQIARASVEELPFAARSFDLVTSFDVLYCREVADDKQALSEFARVLRPGGCLFIRVPALPMLRGPHDSVVHGIRRYTADELRQKITGVGLQPVRTTYLNSLLLPLIFLIRQWQNLQVGMGAPPHSDVQVTSAPINVILSRILALEAAWVSRGQTFPAGVSVACLAVKPE